VSGAVASIIPRGSSFPFPCGLRAMIRCFSIAVLFTSLCTMSSCSLSEWGPHSVCRVWADYNTLLAPGLYLERDDHLPYPATQVGYYRWMYDKDPGHQYACLGVVPPRTCANCDPVPPGDQPFEYQVLFPGGAPRPSDELWGNKLPEPINIPGTARAESPQNLSAPLGTFPPTGSARSPLPPPPEPDHDPNVISTPPIPDAGELQDETNAPKKPARLPSFDLPVPQPKPIDDNPAPMIGPAAQQGPNLRLTTGQPAPPVSESTPNPESVWPR
jgi:hypothetical protein